MKVVILNTSDSEGGAAIAASRLTNALNLYGNDAKMLVRTKKTNRAEIVSVNQSRLSQLHYRTSFIAERAALFLLNGFDREHLFHASLANTGRSLENHPLIQSADIIHLHWINQGFLSLRNLQQLARLGKPIVWTMHDMWPFSALLHHTGELTDERGIERCRARGISLPYPLLRLQMARKKKLFGAGQFAFVGCSEWIANACRKSPLTDELPIVSIPNPIDTQRFSPEDKRAARQRLGLPTEDKIILFGAVNASDPRKGTNELVEALSLFHQHYGAQHPETRVVIFGRGGAFFEGKVNFPITQMGFIQEESTMIDLYRAADLYVTPSLEENLPNTIMEAMAVGLPCVGFSVGGIPEMITHEENGYVATYRSAEEMARGIDFCLGTRNSELRQKARAKVCALYTQEKVAQRYSTLYEELLETNKRNK